MHVSKLGKSWDEAYAKKMLSNFMRMNGNAFEIFYFESEDTTNEDAHEEAGISSQEIEENEKPVFSDQWYVGNFVHHPCPLCIAVMHTGTWRRCFPAWKDPSADTFGIPAK